MGRKKPDPMVTLTGRLSELAVDMSARTLARGESFVEGLVSLSQGGRDTERDKIADILAGLARERTPPVVNEKTHKLVSPPPATILDFTVRVDRSVKPSYPSRYNKVLYPELEGTGPAEYDLQRDVEQRLHDDQRKGGAVSGYTIYKALKRDNAMAYQLGLADLMAIQKMGIAVFRALFKGKSIFGWKSVVDVLGRGLFVPYLCELGDGDEAVLGWLCLDIDWSYNNPALRFRKPA